MAIELNNVDPVTLQSATLGALCDAAQRVRTWDQEQAELLDHTHCVRFLGAVCLPDPEDELRQLSAYLRKVVPWKRVPELDGMEPRFHARWQTMADVCDMRIEQLGEQSGKVPGAVMKRAHVADILKLLKQHRGGMPRAILESTLGLKSPNLTRVLKVMESHGLVHRETEGKRKRVYLRGLEVVPTVPPEIDADGMQSISEFLAENLDHFRLVSSPKSRAAFIARFANRQADEKEWSMLRDEVGRLTHNIYPVKTMHHLRMLMGMDGFWVENVAEVQQVGRGGERKWILLVNALAIFGPLAVR